MRRTTILKKAFEQAKKNGYEITLPSNIDGPLPMEKVIEYGIYYKFIFNHEFANAFFPGLVFSGEKMIISEPGYYKYLREMVVEKDPIKYLEQFLKDEK